MDRNKADEIAKAFLEPDVGARMAREAARTREARRLARQRRIALGVLVGFALGALAAPHLGVRFAEGGLWGGLAGCAVAWLWAGWQDRRTAPQPANPS
jgi:hypothetical protein